jgi:rhamnogalacturonyl hydrolase YesR
MSENIKASFIRLKTWCENEGFKGYDPYDGLNSKFFQALPFLPGSRTARLAWIQLFKLSPLNLRPFLGVSKDYNPKALGLFLSGYCNIYKANGDQEALGMISFFVKELKSLVSKSQSGACWGYNFDWQAKAFYQPKFTPTVVATSFIGNAFLDAYEIISDKELLRLARSSCDYVMKDLNRTYDNQGNFAFSYSHLDKSVVFNASLLGSRLLARVYSFTDEIELISTAGKSVAYCCDHQHADGSWNYGTAEFHKWIDNFHTGYNLECISSFMKHSGSSSYEENLQKGFDFYLKSFFTDQGISKYYYNSVYPIDIHAPAQLIITLSRLGKLKEYKEYTEKVIRWTIENMQSEKGYFYYQKKRYYTSRIPYMRWAQAWMFYALSEYLLNTSAKAVDN